MGYNIGAQCMGEWDEGGGSVVWVFVSKRLDGVMLIIVLLVERSSSGMWKEMCFFSWAQCSLLLMFFPFEK